MLLTLLAVSFIVFAAFEIIPGDAAVSRLGSNATKETVEALRAQMGLDRPFIVRYLNWLFGFVKGDFGTSYSYNLPVSSMILEKLPITITLTIVSMLLTIGVSIPLSLLIAKYAGSRFDKISYGTNQFVMSVPKPGGYISYKKDFIGFLGYLILPAIAIAIPKCAMSIKLLRSAILTEAGRDYVRTAYSRGLSTMEVLYRHVLKNAMIPLITFWGMAVADMIAGSIVVEQVFNIPGLGRILLTSIANRDYPVVEAVILLIAFVVLIMNLVVDVLYRVVDPRLRKD